jgi:GTP-binding protein Era
VGKSTLINALLGQKLVIVSPKPQTTRHRIMGILTGEHYQVVFMDTPGLHRPRTRFGEYMVWVAAETLEEADIILWLVDASRDPDDDDRRVAEAVSTAKEATLALVLNKTDLVDASAVRARQALYSELAPGIAARFQVSALKGEGLDRLLEWVVDELPEGPRYYPEDQVTDREERFLAAELIREQVLHHLRQEVPHSVAVGIDEFVERTAGKTYIRATLYVEKESQKGIIIGTGGATLRRISTAARAEIERLLDQPVFLELWVKVRPNWRRRDAYLRELGFTPPPRSK